MKKVLYISNIEVPYRVHFFNELAKGCYLTVLYESRGFQKRDRDWATSEEKHFRVCYVGKDLLPVLRQHWDAVILGCYHTPLQILAGLIMRAGNIPYFINLDGEPFLAGNSLKARCKRFLLSGGAAYLTAGEKAAESLKKAAGGRKITSYPFSSLTEAELGRHKEAAQKPRSNTILVVGQYFGYKGMDVALEAARLDASRYYRFVGMGMRTEKFAEEHQIPDNVELVPFLQKEDMEREYQSCALLVLPSRRECWGLVVNEAASFGTPVVSTWGSGAAVEFLAGKYPQYLAQPGNAEELLGCIRSCLEAEDLDDYRRYLLEKGSRYSIEGSVRAHLAALGETEP